MYEYRSFNERSASSTSMVTGSSENYVHFVYCDLLFNCVANGARTPIFIKIACYGGGEKMGVAENEIVDWKESGMEAKSTRQVIKRDSTRNDL